MPRVLLVLMLIGNVGCALLHPIPAKSFIESPLAVFNNDTFSLVVYYAPPGSDESRRFYRAFYDTFAKLYQQTCPLPSCLAAAHSIALEEEYIATRSEHMMVVSTRDELGRTLAIYRMKMNSFSTPEFIAQQAVRWTTRALLQ